MNAAEARAKMKQNKQAQELKEKEYWKNKEIERKRERAAFRKTNLFKLQVKEIDSLIKESISKKFYDEHLVIDIEDRKDFETSCVIGDRIYLKNKIGILDGESLADYYQEKGYNTYFKHTVHGCATDGSDTVYILSISWWV